jgi:YVTN family beta-propeller protein
LPIRAGTVVEYKILGSFEVVDADRRVDVGSPRQRALLAVLLLHRGQPVSSDRLIECLWGEQPPATAPKIVQGYVSHLRRVLQPGSLITSARGYLLLVGDATRARELLGSALSMWRGDALADFAYERFAEGEAARLEEMRLSTLEDRLDADLNLGRHRDLVGELGALSRRYPSREALVGQLMLALYRSGRQADALEAFRRGRAALADELGLEPGPELRALEQQILNHDPALEVVTPRAGPAAHVRGIKTGASMLLIFGGLLLLASVFAAALIELTGSHAAAVRVGSNAIAGIDVRSNQVTAAASVGAGPGAIAYGDGSLWVANVDDQTISRMNPRTLQSVGSIPLSQAPTGLAVSGDGVWAVTANPSTRYVMLHRIDPQFDHVDRSVRIANIAVATGAAVAAQGASVWVAPYSGDLTRVDAESARVKQRVDPHASPAGLAVGIGAEWVTDSEAGTVERIDPTGVTTSIRVGDDPSGITVGGGAVWVAVTGEDRLVRIDPTTQAVTDVIPVGRAPLGVTYGAGSVWVANAGDGTISRIDAHVTSIRVGGSPQAIVVAEGRAWVSVDAPVFPRGANPATTLRVEFSEAAGSAALTDTLDPAIADDPLSWEVLYATCARLVNYPDRSGPAASKLVPKVARSMPLVSNGGRTYTFTIRSGFRFAPPSNQPVTAETFKATFERTLNPKMANPDLGDFEDIVGVKSYVAHEAKHISGIRVSGNKLSITLTAPNPDLPARLAEPFFCAVPPDTPIIPAGVSLIPSAGPYTVSSFRPGEGIVLVRNPNYHGDRPLHFKRIDIEEDITANRAVADVETGLADFTPEGATDAAQAKLLNARYGPRSRAARDGHQQYFVDAQPEIDFFDLNSHRRPFSSERLRRAVSYAINRRALASLGDAFAPLPEVTFDHYLPPGIPGYKDVALYPPGPDLSRARELAAGYAGSTVVLYTCDYAPCSEQARIVQIDLAAIGLHVIVRSFTISAMYSRYLNPREPFDMGLILWSADRPDPDDFLNLLLETDAVVPEFDDRRVARELAAASRLAGRARALAYAKLDKQLATREVPWVVFGNQSSHDLFSTRVGCQVFSPYYDMDLAALCLRGTGSSTNRN